MGNVINIAVKNPHTGKLKKINTFDKIVFKGVYKSEINGKKYKAVFVKYDTEHVIHFGNSDIEDFTRHLNPALKQCYIAKNHTKEWCDPMNEKALTRWILWNRPTLNGSVKDYKERFALA